MEISYNRGIIIKDGSNKLFLDPEISKIGHAAHSIITHAHSDHTQGMSSPNKTFATQQTVDLYEASQRKKTPRNISNLNYYEPVEIEGFEVEFLPAGHLLGAAQVIVRKGNETIHFTGDFCPEPLLSVEGAKIPKDIDVSIVDSTYGDERILFDDRLNERQRIFVWTLGVINSDVIPVIHVAHLGGAQELISLFNKLAPNLKILVHENIGLVNEIYLKNGIDLTFQVYHDLSKENLTEEKCVILLPRAQSNCESFLEEFKLESSAIKKGIVTGQTAKFGFNSFDFSSNLSTHASYNELIDVIKQIDPAQVLTHYGFSERLAYTLSVRYDIPSMELSSCNSLDISMINKRRQSYKNIKKGNYDLKKRNEEIWNEWFE